jgi:hypothetical protein
MGKAPVLGMAELSGQPAMWVAEVAAKYIIISIFILPIE